MWILHYQGKIIHFTSLRGISSYLNIPLSIIQSFYYKKRRIINDYEELKTMTIIKQTSNLKGFVKENKKIILEFD